MTAVTQSTCEPQPVPLEWIERLFEHMTGLYGARFLDLWRGVDMDAVKETWATALGTLTREELRRGHAALTSREFPPTLPQFLALCRPRVDLETAFYEAVEGMNARERGEFGTWSHPAVYWAAVTVGAWDMRHGTYSQLQTRWKNAFERFFQGGPCADIPQPAKALPAPGKAPLSRENAARMIQELRADGVFKVSEDRTDHLRWAKRILQRVADGDKEITQIQKSFATEALRNAGLLGEKQ